MKALLIDEVIREKKIKFFNEPRLGSYFAIDISYMSSFSKEVLKINITILIVFRHCS